MKLRLQLTLVPVLLAAALLARGDPAQAQASVADKAAAEALFQEGKTLFERGEYEQACSKFAASQEIDAGVGTLLFLGDCFERSGRTASAWATLKEAAGLARTKGQAEREAYARKRAGELEGRLCRLVLRAPPSAQSVVGLEVKLNGGPVPRASWGTPVPVDPGTQTVEVSAPGYQTSIQEIPIEAPGTTTPVDLRQLEPLPAPTPAAPSPAPPVMGDQPSPTPTDPGASQRTLGWVLGGAGIAGLVVGGVFGGRAMSKNDDSMDHCRTDTLCDPEGLDLRDQARSAATVSTVAFAAGAVLTGGGLVLLLTAEPSPGRAEAALVEKLELSPGLGPGQAGLLLGGAW